MNITQRTLHPLGYEPEDDTPPAEDHPGGFAQRLPSLPSTVDQQAIGANIGMRLGGSLMGLALHHVPGVAADVIADAEEPVPTI